MIPRAIKASILRGYLQRNFEQMTSGMGLIGAWRSYLQSVTGKNDSSITSLEAHRLAQLGYTTGSLVDRWRAFMASEGYGQDIGDALRAYFQSGTGGGGVPPDDQTFDAKGQPIGLLLALTYS